MVAVVYFILGAIYCICDLLGNYKTEVVELDARIDNSNVVRDEDKDSMKRFLHVFTIPFDIVLWPLCFICDVADKINRRTNR